MNDTMSPRERVRRTFQHQIPDRMPRTLDIGASSGIDETYRDIFVSHTGAMKPEEFFDYDIRIVLAPLTPQATDFSVYYDSVPPGTTFDAFGVAHVAGDRFPLGMDLHPWKSFQTPREIDDYPFPIFEPEPVLRETIRTIRERGYMVSVPSGSINEWCYALRGMDEFFIDLVDRPEMAEAVIRRVATLVEKMVTVLSDLGADILCLYGDMGSQQSLLISPRLWGKWIQPYWKTITETIHRINPQAFAFYHSCGAIETICPGLIDAGFDILNPVQPECMDPYVVKKRYGDRMALWGGIGMQSTMLSHSPATVREDISRLVEVWAPGGATMVTVAQTLQSDVPWENVEILLETVEEVSRQIYSRR
ncbi:MAG: hypothetical protein NTX88_03720 [Candidatus Atribacteria bacterium]|nr:hypothetical protein [Candidatus Atribacteria bacterium]